MRNTSTYPAVLPKPYQHLQVPARGDKCTATIVQVLLPRAPVLPRPLQHVESRGNLRPARAATRGKRYARVTRELRLRVTMWREEPAVSAGSGTRFPRSYVVCLDSDRIPGILENSREFSRILENSREFPKFLGIPYRDSDASDHLQHTTRPHALHTPPLTARGVRVTSSTSCTTRRTGITAPGCALYRGSHQA